MNRDPILSGFAVWASKPENGTLGKDLSVADEPKGAPDAVLGLHSRRALKVADGPTPMIRLAGFVTGEA